MQRGQKSKKTTATKEAASPDSTYLEKMKIQKLTSLPGRKKIASQEVMSVMMHCFLELSCRPLQGILTLTRLDAPWAQRPRTPAVDSI
jgi:hypothetical protein